MTIFSFYISASLLLFGHGTGLVWFAMALPLLQSDETPIESGPLTIHELSWAGSLIMIGALTGNLLFCVVVKIIGAKNSTLFLGLPQFVSILD